MTRRVRRLTSSSPGFEDRFTELLSLKREESDDVDAVVAEIIARVRSDGDAALIDYTTRFDRMTLTSDRLRVSADEVDAAIAACPQDALDALDLAAERIEAYHSRQVPADEEWTDDAGMTLGWRWTPVDAAGLYAPGGTASYPSSVLMNAVPARAAGVPRVAMCVPTPDGAVNPLVLAAARRAGVDEVYRIGGAQAIAALAYGTETIAPVDVVVGPGNAFVAAAKRRVFGRVGIDSIAGPSEVLIIADKGSNPDWLALDLLAQAEHDVSAQSILITDDSGLADAVEAAVDARLETLPRAGIAGESWRQNGAIILVEDLMDAAPLANRIAAEHLEISVDDPEPLSAAIRHAGAIFLGRYTPEAIGDYVGGPNHVLPTARSSRHASGLSVLDFMKRTTLAKADAGSLRAIGPAAVRLAQSETLDAHALSIEVRLAELRSNR